MSRTKTKLANKVHAILDKYEYRTELTDIFGIHGIKWLKTLSVSPIDKIILDTTLTSIESIDNQIQIISKEIARYAWQDSKDVKILLSITGIDIFSAMEQVIKYRELIWIWKDCCAKMAHIRSSGKRAG